MFDRLWDDITMPDRFQRGPLAARVAGTYLTLVVVSWLLFSVYAVGQGVLTPTWVPLPLLVLTFPLSFTCGFVMSMFQPPLLVAAFELLVYGVVISWWLWRVIRGPRYIG